MTRRCTVTEIPRAMTGAYVGQHPSATLGALAAHRRAMVWLLVCQAGLLVVALAAIGAAIWLLLK